MTVELNHTIVWCHDRRRSAAFLTDVLGRPPATPFGPFFVVDLDNGLSLDYHEIDDDAPDAIASQHYAFLIGEDDFDRSFGRIVDLGLDYWADPGRSRPGVVNHNYGGRGVYFEDPDGHLMEIITRPYGSAPR